MCECANVYDYVCVCANVCGVVFVLFSAIDTLTGVPMMYQHGYYATL